MIYFKRLNDSQPPTNSTPYFTPLILAHKKLRPQQVDAYNQRKELLRDPPPNPSLPESALRNLQSPDPNEQRRRTQPPEAPEPPTDRATRIPWDKLVSRA